METEQFKWLPEFGEQREPLSVSESLFQGLVTCSELMDKNNEVVGSLLARKSAINFAQLLHEWPYKVQDGFSLEKAVQNIEAINLQLAITVKINLFLAKHDLIVNNYLIN